MLLVLTSTWRRKKCLREIPKGCHKREHVLLVATAQLSPDGAELAVGQKTAQKKPGEPEEKSAGSKQDNLLFFPSPAFWNFMFIQVILPQTSAFRYCSERMGLIGISVLYVFYYKTNKNRGS